MYNRHSTCQPQEGDHKLEKGNALAAWVYKIIVYEGERISPVQQTGRRGWIMKEREGRDERSANEGRTVYYSIEVGKNPSKENKAKECTVHR